MLKLSAGDGGGREEGCFGARVLKESVPSVTSLCTDDTGFSGPLGANLPTHPIHLDSWLSQSRCRSQNKNDWFVSSPCAFIELRDYVLLRNMIQTQRESQRKGYEKEEVGITDSYIGTPQKQLRINAHLLRE